MNRRTLSGITIAAAGIFFLAALAHYQTAPAKPAAAGAAAPPEVDVAVVASSTIVDYQSYSGRVEAIDKVEIRPLVPGTIVAAHFKDGSTVKKGDPLFDIDARPYAAEVSRTAAQVAVAEAATNYAAAEAERAANLLPDNAIAKRDYDQTQDAAREARANLQAAQAALEAAHVNLAYTHIVAPVSGRVSRAEMTVGNVVSSGASAPLLTTVVSIAPIYVAFDVDEETYLRYLSHDAKSSVPVVVGLANETGYSRQGMVDSVDNRLDPASGTIRVRARVANADEVLLPGLYARVRVGGGAPHPALLIDDAAVGTDQDKKFVMVVDASSRAQYREITPGPLHDGQRVVQDGLRPGDRIIVNGLQRARPNTPVTAKMVAMGGEPSADTPLR